MSVTPGTPTNLVTQDELTSALLGYVETSDSRLTDSREWTAETISQAEAEAGTATTRRAVTAERMRQAGIALLVDFGLAASPPAFDDADWSV